MKYSIRLFGALYGYRLWTRTYFTARIEDPQSRLSDCPLSLPIQLHRFIVLDCACVLSNGCNVMPISLL
jgi:hypothetical protein